MMDAAIRIMEKAGYNDIADQLRKDRAVSTETLYTIAVIGEFKAGKSTLINRVFLQEDILFTDLMEATAVPTEIRHGPEKRLEVIPILSGPENGPDTREKGTLIIVNPTLPDIQSHTASDTPEGRTRLAARTARALLFWPSPHLEGLSIIDTPGINTVNQAVITATYRIIPRADLVIFVTGPKTLSQTEMAFLSGRVFQEGVTRAIVVIADPGHPDDTPAAPPENLTATVSHQLAGIGRHHVMVLRMSLQRESGPGDILSAIGVNTGESVTDVISELWGNIPDPSPPEDQRPAARVLTDWVKANIRQARIEKTTAILERRVNAARTRIAAELAAMSKSEEDRRRLESDLKGKNAQFQLDHEKLKNAFRTDLTAIRQNLKSAVGDGLNRLHTEYWETLAPCEDLSQIQQRISALQKRIPADMESLLFHAYDLARTAIADLIRDYDVRARILWTPYMKDIRSHLNITDTFLFKIPPFAILALDVMLFARFGPFGPLADVLIRLLIHYIPYVNRAMPAAIAATVLKQQIRRSLAEQWGRLRQSMDRDIDASFEKITDDILEQWNEQVAEQIRTIENALNPITDISRRHGDLTRLDAELNALSSSLNIENPFISP